MEKKQFEIFQAAVQWVADEQRRKQQHKKRSGPYHVQTAWGVGKVNGWIKGKRRHERERDFALVCTSGCCLAGDIVLLNGDRMVSFSQDARMGQVENVEHCIDAAGLVHSINDRAFQLIGVDPEQAGYLFDSQRTADELIEYAEDIAAYNGYEMEIL